jgi:hypothetical protein
LTVSSEASDQKNQGQVIPVVIVTDDSTSTSVSTSNMWSSSCGNTYVYQLFEFSLCKNVGVKM